MTNLLFFLGGAVYATAIILFGAWAERVRRRRELNDRRKELNDTLNAAAEIGLPMQDVNGAWTAPVDEMKWHPEGSYFKSPYNNGK